MLKIFYRAAKEKRIRRLKQLRPGVWVLAVKPSKKEIIWLSEKLSLDRSLLLDALDPHEVPRVEHKEGITYVFFRLPYRENGHVITAPILMVLGSSFIVTVSPQKLPFINKFLKKEIDFSTTQRTKLFFQFLFEVNLLYGDLLTSIRKEMRQISIGFEQVTNHDIVRFVSFENTLNDFLSALEPTNASLNLLLSGKFFPLYEKDKDLIGDLMLSNRQLIELCKANLKMIVNVREAYSTIMSNNLNRIMKFLTALTIVLTIPSIISGFYGMNVTLPLADRPFAFSIILLGSVLVSVLLLIVFVAKKWI